MEITLRLEREEDFRRVEEITREAFWNHHVPGCDEHFLIRNLRGSERFIPALDFVAVCGGKLIGSIVYMEASIRVGENEHRVLTFGPLSVLPEYQRKGIGSALVRHTLPLAKELGYGAVIIYGDPAYYTRFGFKASKEFSIANNEKKYPAALLVLELVPSALAGIEGIFEEGADYAIDPKEAEEFDKSFNAKEKLVTESQEKFKKIAGTYL